jgi:predicted acyltransferase
VTISRLRSVDVARGLTVAAMLIVNDPGDWSHVCPWLERSAWNGCTAADVISGLPLDRRGVGDARARGTHGHQHAARRPVAHDPRARCD